MTGLSLRGWSHLCHWMLLCWLGAPLPVSSSIASGQCSLHTDDVLCHGECAAWSGG